MKSYLKLLCVIWAALTFAKAERCKLDGGRVYNAGEIFLIPGQCRQFTCTGENQFFATSCSTGQPARNSCTYVPQNDTLEFPYCCPHYDCKEK